MALRREGRPPDGVRRLHVARCFSTWLDPDASSNTPCHRRIIAATIDARLIALDARTGTPCPKLGTNGTVSLRGGLRNKPFEFAEYEVTSPPAIVRGTIVVGSAVSDNNRYDAASGEVRAYDARTASIWTWDPGAAGSAGSGVCHMERRLGASHRCGERLERDRRGPERGLVFVPTSAPSPDYYGALRRGRNDYANSVVALRAATGEVVWHFQTVHHDLWDYDNASPPALVDLTIEGRVVPAVLQATKTGMLLSWIVRLACRHWCRLRNVLYRRAMWRARPRGRRSPSARCRCSARTVSVPIRHSGSHQSRGKRAAHKLLLCEMNGVFTPPSLRGTLAVPSNIGGAHWGGLAWYAPSGIAVVPVNTIAAFIRLVPAAGTDERALRRDAAQRGHQVNRLRGTPYLQVRGLLIGPDGVPCTPPPFGKLVAVDVSARRILWDVPLGDLRHSAVPGSLDSSSVRAASGAPNLGGPIVTAGGLVFIAATLDPRLRAFDISSGRELWSAALPAGGKATPMTYVGADGRQYIVIAAGGDGERFGRSDAVVAFALPSVDEPLSFIARCFAASNSIEARDRDPSHHISFVRQRSSPRRVVTVALMIRSSPGKFPIHVRVASTFQGALSPLSHAAAGLLTISTVQTVQHRHAFHDGAEQRERFHVIAHVICEIDVELRVSHLLVPAFRKRNRKYRAHSSSVVDRRRDSVLSTPR